MAYTINPQTGKFEAISTESPGGADTEIQYNNAGSFEGTTGLNWDETNKSVSIPAISRLTKIITEHYTAVEADNIIIVEGQYNITLPKLSQITAGRDFTIKNNFAGAVGVIGHDGELIDDNVVVKLGKFQSITIAAATSNWVIIRSAVEFPDGTRSKCFMDEVNQIPVNFAFQQDGDDYEYQDSVVPVATIKDFQELTDVDFQNSDVYEYQGV